MVCCSSRAEGLLSQGQGNAAGQAGIMFVSRAWGWNKGQCTAGALAPRRVLSTPVLDFGVQGSLLSRVLGLLTD